MSTTHNPDPSEAAVARPQRAEAEASGVTEPRASLEALLENPMDLELRDDLPTLVPSVSETEFVQLARGLGEDQRLDLLLPYASADQLTGVFDLEAWTRDRIDVQKARFWLHCIVTHRAEVAREPGELSALMIAMDPEMWTFALLHGTAVAEINLDDDSSRDEILDSMGALRTWEVPGGYFIVGVRDDDFGRMALDVLQSMMQDDPETGTKLLQSIKWSMPSQIEEDLLQWRTGRLADLGFPTWEQAMELFRPLSVAQLERRAARDTARAHADASASQPDAAGASEASSETKSAEDPPDGDAGVHHVGWVPKGSLLRSISERMDARQRGNATREFSLLANELLIAQQFEPGDEAQRHRALRQTEATLELGCEMILRGTRDPAPEQRVVDHIGRVGLRGLFRVAYGALNKLRSSAQSLHQSGRASVSSPGSFLDKPWGPALAQLSARFPELPAQARPADDPRDSRGRKRKPAHPRTLASLADLAEATRLLAEAAALVTLAFDPTGFAVDPVWLTRADDPDRLRIGDFIRTALIRRLVGAAGDGFGPLSAEVLAYARRDLLDLDGDHHRLLAQVSVTFSKICESAGVPEHATALAEVLLTRLEVELTALEFEGEEVRIERTGGILTDTQFTMWKNSSTSAN